jgi:hypothetical protein
MCAVRSDMTLPGRGKYPEYPQEPYQFKRENWVTFLIFWGWVFWNIYWNWKGDS